MPAKSSTTPILDGDHYSLAQVCEHIPGRPNISTVFRWVQKGVKGVRLRALRVGARIFISRDAIGEFLDALNAGTSQLPPVPAATREREKQSRIAAAERELTASGF